MGFIDVIKAKAKADKKTIVLPESMDRRTWVAAEKILKEDLANLVIIGTPEDIGAHSEGLDVSGATIINPQTYEKTQEYIDLFVELRKSKGMTPEKAKETILSDYAYYGCLMIKNGDADGMVSGACHSTANTLRPCLQVIKTKPGTKLVSAFFLMEVPDCDLGSNGTFVFADCGLNQNPNPEELAAIAVSSAESFKMLTGEEPKVAMLSHSSKGSAKHADVDKVVEATKLAKEMASFSLTQQSFRKLALPRLRTARLQVMQTFWYSRIWMQETSATSWFRDLARQRLMARCARVSQSRLTICPEAALLRIS